LDIQNLLSTNHSMPVPLQRLIFKGRVLKSDQLLSNYNMEDGDCLHLIMRSSEAAAPASAAAAAEGAAENVPMPVFQPVVAPPLPNLSPNNQLPGVPPPAFGFGPAAAMGMGIMPAGQHVLQFQFPPQVIQMQNNAQPGAGGQQQQPQPGQQQIPGMPIDIGALLGGLFGGAIPLQMQQQPGAGQPQQPQQQQQRQPPVVQREGVASAPGGPAVSVPAAGAVPAAVPGPSPSPTFGAAAAAAPPVAGQPVPGAHPLSHPVLSVNAVRSFLTEVAQNIPRLSSAAPLSMDPRATASSAAVQQEPYPENLAGLGQLLTQTQAVLTNVAPPLLHRIQGSIARVQRTVAQANQHVPEGDPSADSPQQRLALQTQLRQIAFGIRRMGDSLRGLSTLLEAVQVNPQSGDVSLLILPPHLQAGRQMSVGSVPALQLVPNAVHVQGPGGVMGGPMMINGLPPGAQVHVQVQHLGQPQQPNMQPVPQSQPAPPVAAAAVPPAVNPAPAAPVPQPVPQQPAAAPVQPPQQQQPQQQPPNPFAAFMAQLQQPQAGGAGQQQQPFNIMSFVGPMVANMQQPGAGIVVPPAAPVNVGGEGQQQAQPQQQQQQQPNPLAGIMSALGPMFAGLQVPGAPAAAPAPAGAAPPPPAGAPNLGNMISQLMPMMGQVLANPRGGAGGGASLNDLMNGMLGQLGGARGMGAGAGGPASPAAVQRVAAQVQANNPESQREGVQGSRGEGELGGDPDRIDAEDEGEGDDEPASLFDLLLSQMMAHLSLPDLMGLMSGNFSGLERLRAPFREMLVDMLGDDMSDQSRSLLVHSFTASIIDSMLDPRAMALVEAQRIPDGPDPTRISADVVRRHVRALIDLTLDMPIAAEGTAVTASSFSSRLKNWASGFVGEWLVTLSACFRDGLTSSQVLASALLQNKLSSMGGGELAFMMPMIANSMGGVMMKCAQQYQQTHLLGGGGTVDSTAWLQLLPLDARDRWSQIIVADEVIMQRQLAERRSASSAAASVSGSSGDASLYVPLSNAYQSGGGSSAGKRKPHSSGGLTDASSSYAAATSSSGSSSSSSSIAIAVPATPDRRIAEQFERQLGRSIQSIVGTIPPTSSASSNSTIAALPNVERVVSSIPPSLHTAYAEQVASDMRQLVQSHFQSDYQPERFPYLTQRVMQPQHKEK
jgi:hypothetical protein